MNNNVLVADLEPEMVKEPSSQGMKSIGNNSNFLGNKGRR